MPGKKVRSRSTWGSALGACLPRAGLQEEGEEGEAAPEEEDDDDDFDHEDDDYYQGENFDDDEEYGEADEGGNDEPYF